MKSNEFEMEPLILSLKPGASYKHFDPSESDTFIYCLKGCVTLTLGNSRYQANEQDVLYFRANEIHQLHNETTDEIEILIVATKIIFIKGSIVMEPLLSFKGVTKGFDDVTILNKMDLEIESGHFYTLLGPSGCGKTTILKLIAGFEQPDDGDIIYLNKSIGELPANKKKGKYCFPRLCFISAFECL